MDTKLKLIADTFGLDRVKFNQPLAEFTTLKVGGIASLFFIAFTQKELLRMIEFCRDLKVPFFIFGTGSKMMISEKGFLGVVIKNRTKNTKIISIKGKVGKGVIGVESALIEIESGLSMNSFVEFLDKQGLQSSTFINSSGSLGGNLFINQDLQEKIESVKTLDEDSNIEEISIDRLSLQKHVILSAVLRIKSKI